MTEKHVQTLDRALDILEVLARNEEALGVTEIGVQVGLHKSTVHRILQTLCYRGYVEKEKNRERYRLGIKTIELGIQLLNGLEIRTIAAPHLTELSKLFGEVVHLVLADDGEAVYIDKRESSRFYGMSSKVGRRVPMHCTAVGKALLSTLPDKDILNILQLKGMPAFTFRTITDPQTLLHELAVVRQTGIAIEEEENEIGILCVASPIFDCSGHGVGAISISGPTNRLHDKGLDTIGLEISRVGRHISTQLGYVKDRVLNR